MLGILPFLWENPHTGLDVNGDTISTDRLCGKGTWADGHTQARVIPPEVLKESRKAAERAFLRLPSTAPQISYSKIVQRADETFMLFVERLRKGMESQVQGEETRTELLREVASTNANTACRDAILSLPLDPPPTLQRMLEICARKVIIPSGDLDHRARPPPHRVTAANTLEAIPVDPSPAVSSPDYPPLPSTPQPIHRSTSPCHLCGKIGHWMPDCPLRRQFYEFKKHQGIQGGPPTAIKLGAKRSPLLRKDINKAGLTSSCGEGNKGEPPAAATKCDHYLPDLSCLLCL